MTAHVCAEEEARKAQQAQQPLHTRPVPELRERYSASTFLREVRSRSWGYDVALLASKPWAASCLRAAPDAGCPARPVELALFCTCT